MWGSNLKTQDQESHAPPREPVRHPGTQGVDRVTQKEVELMQAF